MNIGASCAFCATGSLTWLGDFSGGSNFSKALAISSDGLTVGGFGTTASATMGFVWTSAGGMKQVGDLTGGSLFSVVNAVSDDGSVAVGQSSSTNGNQAFRYTTSAGIFGCGDLTGGSFYSNALGVSGNGLTVVGQGASASGNEAFRYVGTMISGLGDLSGGSFMSVALSSSSDGSAIFGYSSSGLGVQAFRWTQANSMQPIAMPTGATECYPIACQSSTDFVGQARFSTGYQAVHWTESNGYTLLSDLNGGTLECAANDASPDSSVIVGYGRSADGQRAVIWTPDFGVELLSDVLTSSGVANSTMTLQAATGIAADGRTIAGWGLNVGGNIEAFVAKFVPRMLTGQVTFPGYLGDVAEVKGMLEYRNHANGNLIAKSEIKLATSGQFKIRPLAREVCDIRLIFPSYLVKKIASVDCSVDTISNVNATVLAGDADNDNTISVFDYILLSDAFDSVLGDSRYAASCDFDGDHSITIFDYILQSENFDMSGD
jgi:uncharacterized membrane protein